MSKDGREYSDYDGINFRTDKKSKNKFTRRTVKNILKNIDINALEEDYDSEDLFEDFEN